MLNKTFFIVIPLFLCTAFVMAEDVVYSAKITDSEGNVFTFRSVHFVTNNFGRMGPDYTLAIRRGDVTSGIDFNRIKSIEITGRFGAVKEGYSMGRAVLTTGAETQALIGTDEVLSRVDTFSGAGASIVLTRVSKIEFAHNESSALVKGKARQRFG